MKIFDAVYTAAVFLQLNELCDILNDENFSAEDWRSHVSGEQAADLDILIRCCNLVLSELAAGDFAIKAKSTVTATDGKIESSALPSGLRDIYCIEANGKSIPFKEYYNCITLPYSGEVYMEYSLEPAAVSLCDDSPFGGNKPSARLTAYGIAREYCLISGMTDEAAVWDSRFVACANDESRSRREKHVRLRKWR